MIPDISLRLDFLYLLLVVVHLGPPVIPVCPADPCSLDRLSTPLWHRLSLGSMLLIAPQGGEWPICKGKESNKYSMGFCILCFFFHVSLLLELIFFQFLLFCVFQSCFLLAFENRSFSAVCHSLGSFSAF